jgi:hypothetical protein
MNFNNLTGEIIDPIKEQSTLNEFTNFLTRNKGTISIIIALSLVLILVMVLALCFWKKSKKTAAVNTALADAAGATAYAGVVDSHSDDIAAGAVPGDLNANSKLIADFEAKLVVSEAACADNDTTSKINAIDDLKNIQDELNKIADLKTDLNEAKNKIAGDLEENLQKRFDAVNTKLDQITQALNARKSIIEEANKQAEITAKTITTVHAKFINDHILKDTKRELIVNGNSIVVKGTGWFANTNDQELKQKKNKIAANIAELKVAGDNKNAYQAFCKMATDNGNGSAPIPLSDDEKKAIVAFCNDPKMHPNAQVTTSGDATQVAHALTTHK